MITELLWVAPELLSEYMMNAYAASHKGDVYSFAIILEEIVVRGGPYENAKDTLTTEGRLTRNFQSIVSQNGVITQLLNFCRNFGLDKKSNKSNFSA